MCDAAEPDELLGVIGLHDIDLTGEPGGVAEIGYWMRPVGRGRGLMSRAVRVASTWGVDELGLTRITWCAIVGNEASRRIAEGNGYVVEGLLRRMREPRGVRERPLGGRPPVRGPAAGLSLSRGPRPGGRRRRPASTSPSMTASQPTQDAASRSAAAVPATAEAGTAPRRPVSNVTLPGGQGAPSRLGSTRATSRPPCSTGIVK